MKSTKTAGKTAYDKIQDARLKTHEKQSVGIAHKSKKPAKRSSSK